MLNKTEMTDTRVFAEKENAEAKIITREWSLPLRTESGEILGALSFFGQITQRDQEMFSAIAAEAAELARLTLDHCRLQSQLTDQAQHAALTFLPNSTPPEARSEEVPSSLGA